MSRNQELQNMIDVLHTEFRQQGVSDKTLRYDSVLAAAVNKHFSTEQAESFFELHAGLLWCFAEDLFEFMIGYMDNMTGE